MRAVLSALAAVAVMLLASPAPAAPASLAAPPPTSSTVGTPLSGHYYLEGVMETGSELLLMPDGGFQWYLVYGALDLFAEGRWSQADGKVTLVSSREDKAPPPGFDTLVLTVRGQDLIPPDGKGAYVRKGDAPVVVEEPVAAKE